MRCSWQRYYDPNTGRYVSPDPMGVESDPSLYSYAGNNPVRWTDPSGLLKFSTSELKDIGGECCDVDNWVAGIAALQRFLSVTPKGQECRSRFYGEFGVDPLVELIYGKGPDVSFYNDPAGRSGRYDPYGDELEMNTEYICGGHKNAPWQTGRVIWHELIHLHEGFLAAHLPPEHSATFESLNDCVGYLQ